MDPAVSPDGPGRNRYFGGIGSLGRGQDTFQNRQRGGEQRDLVLDPSLGDLQFAGQLRRGHQMRVVPGNTGKEFRDLATAQPGRIEELDLQDPGDVVFGEGPVAVAASSRTQQSFRFVVPQRADTHPGSLRQFADPHEFTVAAETEVDRDVGVRV